MKKYILAYERNPWQRRFDPSTSAIGVYPADTAKECPSFEKGYYIEELVELLGEDFSAEELLELLGVEEFEILRAEVWLAESIDIDHDVWSVVEKIREDYSDWKETQSE